jgi:hypothetical protein
MPRPRRSSQASSQNQTAGDSNNDVRSEPSETGSGTLETMSGAAGDPDSIALRAYQRYEERGREDGRDLEDWVAAERELANRDEE